jgi:hypothetical protein
MPLPRWKVIDTSIDEGDSLHIIFPTLKEAIFYVKMVISKTPPSKSISYRMIIENTGVVISKTPPSRSIDYRMTIENIGGMTIENIEAQTLEQTLEKTLQQTRVCWRKYQLSESGKREMVGVFPIYILRED